MAAKPPKEDKNAARAQKEVDVEKQRKQEALKREAEEGTDSPDESGAVVPAEAVVADLGRESEIHQVVTLQDDAGVLHTPPSRSPNEPKIGPAARPTDWRNLVPTISV